MGADFYSIVFSSLLTFVLASPSVNETRAVSICQSPGIFCLDKHTLGYCVASGGQYQEYAVKDCRVTNNWCSHSMKDCSDKASFWALEAIYPHFLCMQQGIFPDPFDCNVYYECPEPQYTLQEDYAPSKTYLCDVGTAYNYGTGKCDLPSSHPTCAESGYPVPPCNAPIEGGPLSLNPNYYWMCVNHIVRIFRCPDGYKFDGTTYKCYSDGVPTAEPPTVPPPGDFQCPDKGRYADPQSCHRFYDCSKETAPALVSCPLGKYFHRRKQICLLGFCPY